MSVNVLWILQSERIEVKFLFVQDILSTVVVCVPTPFFGSRLRRQNFNLADTIPPATKVRGSLKWSFCLHVSSLSVRFPWPIASEKSRGESLLTGCKAHILIESFINKPSLRVTLHNKRFRASSRRKFAPLETLAGKAIFRVAPKFVIPSTSWSFLNLAKLSASNQIWNATRSLLRYNDSLIAFR